MQKLRLIVQWLFFILFLVLMVVGKAQLWMAFIFISILLSIFFGRYYCGWACPINTMLRPANWIKRKLGLSDKGIPEILRSERPRWLLFLLFLFGLGYTIYTIRQGRKFPLPLIIIPLGMLVIILISERAWHRYLCPWGVLFSLTGRFAWFNLKVVECTSCSLCQSKCPAKAITTEEDGAAIDPTYCLLCLECQGSCPVDAIDYRK